jgi:hypothetical protein
MPTIRDAGLSEAEAGELEEEDLVDFSLTNKADDALDQYRVRRLTKKAFGLLARADHAEQRKPSIIFRILKGVALLLLVVIPGIFISLNQFNPNLVISSVRTPDSKFESEGRLELRNNGNFSITGLKPTWHQVRMSIRSLNLEADSVEDGVSGIARLSNGETVFIPILPSTYTKQATEVTQCQYNLKIKFRQQLLFIKSSEMERNWKVSLRKPGNAPSQWDITPIDPQPSRKATQSR